MKANAHSTSIKAKASECLNKQAWEIAGSLVSRLSKVVITLLLLGISYYPPIISKGPI